MPDRVLNGFENNRKIRYFPFPPWYVKVLVEIRPEFIKSLKISKIQYRERTNIEWSLSGYTKPLSFLVHR